MDLDMISKKRRSIRKLREGAAMDPTLVKEMLQAVVQAPSWKDSQAVKYYVVMSRRMLGKIKASYFPKSSQKDCKDTPMLIATVFVRNHSGHGNQGSSVNEVSSGRGCYDLGLHDSHLILKAKDPGPNTLIVGICDADALGELLDTGQGQEVVSVIAVGYRDTDPTGSNRKDLDETTRFY